MTLICKENDINGHYIEPSAGGASVALHLLFKGQVREITINDYDRAIYAFWYSVLNSSEKFCRKIRKTEVTVENWKKFKKIHKNKDKESLFDLGFATFFLNRTNRSGIIDGGVIGGLGQKGNYKIDCRFNKEELIDRIKFIATYKKRIHLYDLNALELIRKIKKEGNSKGGIFYFDPPYYLKGPSLYMSHYKYEDHKKVSEEIKKIKNIKWIVSYDNVPEIKKLYSLNKKKEYSFFHTAYEIRKGKEVLFFSDGLIIPRIGQPTRM
ncbi:MAG: DNA adenine methylase [bacterium]